MKRSRMKSSASSSSNPSAFKKYLPPEVWSLILEKLPVKMLLRFRCVCRFWLSIIDNPDFAYTHLQVCNHNNNFNSNINSGKLLLLEGSGQFFDDRCKLTLRKAVNLRKIGNFFESSERFYFYGMCKSLVLMGRDIKLMENGLRISNPSVRKSLQLPCCPLYHPDEKLTSFIFGFVPRTEDFKVIAFQLQGSGDSRRMCAAVYTLKEHNWVERVNAFNLDFSSCFREFRGFYSLSNPSYLEGAVHWLGKPPSDNNGTYLFFDPTHLISLDLDTENFSLLDLPVLDEGSLKWRFVFVLGENLAIFNSSPTSSNIWLLTHVDGVRTWTLWFSGPSSEVACQVFGDLDKGISVLYFDGEGDRGSLLYEKNSYNIASGQVRSMAKSMTRHVEFKLYSESLVLAGVVDKDSPFSWNE